MIASLIFVYIVLRAITLCVRVYVRRLTSTITTTALHTCTPQRLWSLQLQRPTVSCALHSLWALDSRTLRQALTSKEYQAMDAGKSSDLSYSRIRGGKLNSKAQPLMAGPLPHTPPSWLTLRPKKGKRATPMAGSRIVRIL